MFRLLYNQNEQPPPCPQGRRGDNTYIITLLLEEHNLNMQIYIQAELRLFALSLSPVQGVAYHFHIDIIFVIKSGTDLLIIQNKFPTYTLNFHMLEYRQKPIL